MTTEKPDAPMTYADMTPEWCDAHRKSTIELAKRCYRKYVLTDAVYSLAMTSMGEEPFTADFPPNKENNDG